MPETITITDNRTGKSLEIPIHNGGVSSAEWQKILPGIWFHDLGLTTTAMTESAISYLEHLIRDALDDAGARIVVLVDPVTEALQPSVSLLDSLHVVGNVLHGTDLGEHAHDRLVRSAVTGPV